MYKNNKYNFREYLKNIWSEKWIPSRQSTILLSLIFIAIFLITQIGVESPFGTFGVIDFIDKMNIRILKAGEGLYQNLIAITAGIGAVEIGLAFFVAQSLLDKDDPDKARVLLYRSDFFPLLASVVAILIMFIRGKCNYFMFVAILILGIKVIYSLKQTIFILVRPIELEKAKYIMFKKILKDSFHDILKKERKQRKFIDEIYLREKNSSFVDIQLFLLDKKNSNDIRIEAGRSGIITDIDFDKLEKLIHKIEVKNNKNKVKEQAENIVQDSNVTNNIRIYINSDIYTKVEAETVLLKIDNDILNEIDEREMRIACNEIFKIDEVDTAERFELIRLRTVCLNHIENENTVELEKSLNLYKEIIIWFLKDSYDGEHGITKEQAEAISHNIFIKGMKGLKYISDDVKVIFEKAIESSNIDVIRYCCYLPIRFARLSIRYNDYLIYKTYIEYPLRMYTKGFEEKQSGNEKKADFLIDRSWRYVKELIDYFLMPKLEDKEIKDKDFENFNIYIFKLFQNLLKRSFDNNDFDSFKIFLDKILKTYKYEYDLFDDEKRDVNLTEIKNEMLFGLTSWLLYESRTNNKKRNFYDEISEHLPKKIDDLTELFIRTHSFEKEDFWDWADWEKFNSLEGAMYSIDILGKLEALYAVMALRILSEKSNEAKEDLKLPTSKELLFLAEGSRNLISEINQIKNNESNLTALIPKGARKECDLLLELLKDVEKRQNELDLNNKRNAQLETNKIEEFRNNVWKSMCDNFGMKLFLENYNLIEREKNEISENVKARFGINTLFDKGAFISNEVDPTVTYVGIEDGFGFGRAIVNGENINILEKIRSKAENIDYSEFLDSEMSKLDCSRGAFLLINYSSYHFSKKWCTKLLKNDNKIFKNASGIVQTERIKIPVYEISDSDLKGFEVLFIDIDTIGNLKQYSPLREISEKENRIEDIMVSVEVIDESLNWVQEPPKWLREKGNKNQQLKYLKERVIVKIYENFEFNIDENAVVYKMN